MSLLPANFVADTYGANLVGTLMSCVSYGMLLAVGWSYCSRFPNDRWVYKGLSAVMILIGTLDTAINCNYVYSSLINHFGIELWILYTNWNFQSNIVLIGTTGVTLNTFMSYRIWIVSERRWVLWPAASIALSFAGMVISIWLSAWYGKQALTLSLATKPVLVWCWFGSATLSELMSTLALNWFLVLRPRKVNNEIALPTRSVLTRLALRAVETNLLSLAVHITIVILYARHDTLYYWYSAPGFVIVKVYAISLIVTLLSRRSEHSSLSHGSSASPAALSHSKFGAGGTSRHQARSGGVTFELETTVHVDESDSLRVSAERVMSPVYVGALEKGGGVEDHELERMESGKEKAALGWN